MKKLNIKNKEINLLVLFGLLALLFISVNLANNYTPQDNFIFDNELPTSSAISINIVSPTTNEYFNATAPGFVVEIDDTVNPIDTMWYTIDGGITNITFTLNGTIDQTEWTAHAEGSVTLTFYSNNSISEEDFASVTINKDSVDPTIDSIDSPLTGAWLDSTPPSYSLSITEVNLDSVWYTLDGGLNNYTGAVSGTIDSTAWNNAGQGAVTLSFYVNDSSGNWDSASVGVNKDSIDPTIDSIDSPLSGVWFNSTPPGYSLSITEVNLDSIWYTLDAGLNNYTGAASGTIDSTAWNNAGQGAVTIVFYVNDSSGNWDSASVGVNKDTINPSLDSIDSPSPGAWFDNTPPSYSLSITEVNLDSIWYTLDAGLNNYTGAASGTIDSTAWNNAGQGAITITFYVNDSVGNWDSASVGVNKDSIDPTIDSIDSPLSGVWFDSTPPGYSLSITEVNLDSVWYTLDAGLNNYTGALSGTIDSTAWSNAGQGAVTITFYVNDSSGNWDSASVGVNKDTLNPSIDSIDSPSLGAWFNSTPPGYSLSITEVNLDSIWYTLDAGLNNYTGAASGTIDSTAWNNAGQGAITITFYVNDSVGNWDSASVGVNKDSIDPTIDSIDSPSLGAWFDSTPPGYSLSITEVNLDSVWYTLDGGLNNYTGALSGTIDSTAWSNAGQGAVTIIFYVNDSAGNWDSLSVNVNKDSVGPSIDSIDSPISGAWVDSTPPGYSLSITEVNLDSVWYTLDGGLNNFTGALSGTIDSTAWSNAGQGAVTIIFYVNDSSGNWDSVSVGVNKDTINPSLDSIDSPSPGAWFNSTPPGYSLSITEVNLDTIWYTLDAGLNNYTGAASGTINSTAWSNAGQGMVTIIFYVNDSAGNWNSMSVSVNKDSIDPSIDSIDSPSPGTWFNSTPPSYSLSITEVNLDSIWYTLDGGLNNYTGALSGTIDSTAWSNAGQGAVTITFYVNDSSGNWDSASVGVNKDTLNPTISIISPTGGQTFGTAAPNFIVEIHDNTLDTMWYTIDGGATNFTFISNGTIDPTAWAALGAGPIAVTLIFYANDSFGLVTSDSVNFNKNANAPAINIVSPTLASYFGTDAPSFIVEITDADLDTMWYTIDGGVTNITFITNGTIDQTEWTAHSDGSVSLIFYANDTTGNIASELVLINKDTAAPTVNILSPLLNQLLGIISPNFLVEIDDPILDTMWYSLDNGANNYTFVTNTTFNSVAWGLVSNGTVTIYFYANDLVGNEAFDSVIVRVDKIIPTITVNLPVDGTVVGTQPIINITVNDVNVDSIWYTVSSTNFALANNTDQLLNILIWNALPEGSFTIELYANDTAGNLNSLYTINLVKDISAPIVTIVYPSPNATYSAAPEIRLTVTDTTLDTAWYSIVGTNYTFEFTPTGGIDAITIDQTAWNALSNGPVTIIFYANDSLGRISSDSITVNRNVAEPFDFIAFLFGPIGLTLMGVVVAIVVIVILLKRRKTHKTSDKEVRKIESLWD